MANVQKENGYLGIANELADAFSRTDLTPSEWRVVWFIVRQTYGYNRRTIRLFLAEIADGTGLPTDRAGKAVRSLIERNILVAEGSRHCKEYGVQKDYDQWRELPKTAGQSAENGSSTSRERQAESADDQPKTAGQVEDPAAENGSSLNHSKDRKTGKTERQGKTAPAITDPFGPWRMLARELLAACPGQMRWGSQEGIERQLREHWEGIKTTAELAEQIRAIKAAGIADCSPRDLFAVTQPKLAEGAPSGPRYQSADEIIAEDRREAIRLSGLTEEQYDAKYGKAGAQR